MLERKNLFQRRIYWPNSRRSREELESAREARSLSARQTYKELSHLHGKELIESPIVKDMLAYASNWDPFIVNTDPKITPGTKGVFYDIYSGEMALPYPYVIPTRKEGESHWGNTLFYWDIYPIDKALLASGNQRYIDIAKGHIENYKYLLEELGYIPNGSTKSINNRTQVPYLTGMIMDIYKITGDKKWLEEKMELAKKEYDNVWMGTEAQAKAKGIHRPSHRIHDDSLLIISVGTDVKDIHYDAAAASTQDDSHEWAGRAPEVLPINLNCAMYKYEKEFAETARILGKTEEVAYWEEIAQRRKQEMDDAFWDEKKGMYFNRIYNRQTKQWDRDFYPTVNTFMPLWLNMATPHQADKVMKNLPKFENPYGLFVAPIETQIDQEDVKKRTKRAYGNNPYLRRMIPAIEDKFAPYQWDYPNNWPPLQYFAFEGMLNYGKKEDAIRIMEKILRSAAAFYQEKGTLSEKVNGETGMNGKDFLYGNKEGYGWHNAVCLIAAGRITELS